LAQLRSDIERRYAVVTTRDPLPLTPLFRFKVSSMKKKYEKEAMEHDG
jgi:hypothetical protein